MSSQRVKVPPRYARVNAWVISRDTDAEVRFLTTAFGGAETPGSRMLEVAPAELASRLADPAAQEAMTYVQRTLRQELKTYLPDRY